MKPNVSRHRHYIVLFDSAVCVQPVQIVCIGEGPVVHITPTDIDWQQIPVLVDDPKTLKLSNESLIPAHFTTNLVLLTVFLSFIVYFHFVEFVDVALCYDCAGLNAS